MNLDLKSLEIFVCVVEEGKISKAAKKLNRVQSNVSTRIKQLEAEVGKQLFVRSARSLQLTAEGGLLLEYAKQMLQLREQASLALGDDTPKGILRVGAMESTAAARLPSIIQTFSHKYPDLHVDLVTDTAAGLFHVWRTGEWNVFLRRNPRLIFALPVKQYFTKNLFW